MNSQFNSTVLLTSVGRRNYLIEYFNNIDCGIKTVAIDSDQTAPGLQSAHHSYTVPKFSSDEYIPVLIDICSHHEVDMLICLHDYELMVISSHMEEIESVGVEAIIPPQDVVSTCLDKLNTYQILSSIGIKVPESFTSVSEAVSRVDSGETEFPFVLKPRFGSSSKHLEIVSNVEELRYQYRNLSKMADYTGECQSEILVEEYLHGAEYNIDVINDLNGGNVVNVPKRKISMRSGETEKAEIVSNKGLDQIGSVLAEHFQHPGNMDVDVIKHNQDWKVIDINPRFGGGYPFTHKAGVDLPTAIVDWYNDNDPDPSTFEYEEGIILAKYQSLTEVGGIEEYPNYIT